MAGTSPASASIWWRGDGLLLASGSSPKSKMTIRIRPLAEEKSSAFANGLFCAKTFINAQDCKKDIYIKLIGIHTLLISVKMLLFWNFFPYLRVHCKPLA